MEIVTVQVVTQNTGKIYFETECCANTFVLADAQIAKECSQIVSHLKGQCQRGVTTLTNAVWAILGLNLSRPGNLDHPPEFLGYISFDVPIFFWNVPEL